MLSGDRNFRASQTYIWRLSDTLGNGAFGSVYRGYHKVSGESVAIKTLNSRMLSPLHLKQHTAELEILKKLDHPNIVKLIGVEQEVRSSSRSSANHDLASQVIVMELGTEGSLYAIIEQPANNFGLPDDELLLILKHLNAGLRYLRREHGVIHRDVKPSNILKTVTKSGEVLYKLCDFGAARVLAEEDSFHSLVGTPEYLHPDIYEPALLTGAPNPHFSANCDLWSIGVTLYQTICGQLPFRPYGGIRGNKQIMYEMTRKKPQGVISGHQESKNGEIKWSRKFPDRCTVSSGLRSDLINLLSNLLEGDGSRRWTYDRFFKEVDSIVSKPPIHCLSISDGRFYTCYGSESLEEVKANLASQLFPSSPEFKHMSWNDIVLIWNGEVLQETSTSRVLRSTSLESPVLVIVPDCNNTGRITPPQLPFVPSSEEKLREEKDCEWAKGVCNLTCWIERQVKAYAAASSASTLGVSQLRSAMEKEVNLLEGRTRQWRQCWNFIQHQMVPLQNCRETCVSNQKILKRKEGSAENISKSLAVAEGELLSAKAALLTLDDGNPTPSTSAIPGYAQQDDFSILSRGRASFLEVFEQFRKDKAMKIGSNPEENANEINWHSLMKRRVGNQWNEVEGCLRGKQFNGLSSSIQKSSSEIKKMLKLHERMDKLEKNLGEIERMINAFDESMNQVAEHHVKNDHTNVSQSMSAARMMESPLSYSMAPSESASDPGLENLVLEMVQCTQDIRTLSQANTSLIQKRVFGLADSPSI